VPIVRTFVPFLAGVAPMRYGTFLINNIIGGVLWIASLVYTGYLFGNVPWVKQNLSLIIVGILVVSVLPIAIKVLQERRKKSP
jgi:membrane-associated protein